MTAVDWNSFRKCPVCAAEMGEPCIEFLGRYVLEGEIVWVQNDIGVPHRGRKQRTGGTP